MKIISRSIQNADEFQRKHRFLGFLHALIKKYGDDQMGHQAALLTYFAFLALFPLLLVLATVAGLLVDSHPSIHSSILESTNRYFPVLGSQLSERVNTIHKTGTALAIGLLIALYGARGVADAFRNGVNHIWGVPNHKRDGFPKSTAKNFAIIILGGLGLVTASLTATMAASAGSGLEFKLLSLTINLIVLFWSFIFILNLSLPKHVTFAEVRSGAATAAIGLVTLQVFGGIVLTRQLKNLDALYSNFAITLGLLFWLYLQSQVVYYAVEIAYIRAKKAYPRSLNGDNPTKADKAFDPKIK